MRLKIATAGDMGLSVSDIEQHISSLGLSESIQLVDSTEDALVIEASRVEEDVELNVPALDFRGRCQPSGIPELVLKCCGYKKIVLNGLCVKDSNGNKFRPAISIFSANTLMNMLPDTLEYTKAPPAGPRGPLIRERMYCSSEILSSLLENTAIHFKDNSNEYEISSEGTQYFMSFSAAAVPLSLDFIVDQTVNGNLAKYTKIRRKHPVFENFFTGRVENLVFNKAFYKRIKNSREAMEELLVFVEHAPKFQDARDDVVEQLRDFVHKNYQYEYIHKYQYLDLYRAKVPRKKCKNSIRSLMWGDTS